MDDISDILTKENIHALHAPANCTDRFQPMDLSVNKSVKEFMRNKFSEWYASQMLKQVEKGTDHLQPIDHRLSVLKPLGARWLISLYDYSIIVTGFKAAGLDKA